MVAVLSRRQKIRSCASFSRSLGPDAEILMWCCYCQTERDTPAPPAVEAYRGNVPLADAPTPLCPKCGSRLVFDADTDLQLDVPSIDDWEERLERELVEVRQLLAESSRLRESTTREDPPGIRTREAAENCTRLRMDRTGSPSRSFGRMTRPIKNALPRTPATILLIVGVGLVSGPWIQGFESIGHSGLSLEWAGQLFLSVGALLWLRDYFRQGEEISGKLDATIAGMHVLRRDIATPSQPNDAHFQLADLKRRLAAVARSVKF